MVASYGIQRSMTISRGLAGNFGSFSMITERGSGGRGGRFFVTTCANDNSYSIASNKDLLVRMAGTLGGFSRSTRGGGERGGGGRCRMT